MTQRVADHPIDKMFTDRWSPRAFTGETIPEAELLSLFEAARWAPSSYNSQPWRFIYARRDTPNWQQFVDLLLPSNSWAKNASALVFVVSKSTLLPPGKDAEIPSHSHSFDAGAGWMSIALQAHLSGWKTHGMVGVDFDTAFATLGVPEGYRIEAAIVIGRQGDKSTLPEGLQARETPNARKPVREFAFEGRFPKVPA